MSNTVKKQIQALIDQETLGLNTKNPDLFLDFIHPDMVWRTDSVGVLSARISSKPPSNFMRRTS